MLPVTDKAKPAESNHLDVRRTSVADLKRCHAASTTAKMKIQPLRSPPCHKEATTVLQHWNIKTYGHRDARGDGDGK